MILYIIVILLFLSNFLNCSGVDISVDLHNPSYRHGILYTSEGGVVRGEELRIQARSLQYINRIENGKWIHRLEAEGDLLVQYKGQAYVGKELIYDFAQKTGSIYDGKTYSSLWYIGGEEVQLYSNGDYRIANAFFTTCEEANSPWDCHAEEVKVHENYLFEAKKISFRFFKIPTLTLPSFKINLKKFRQPLLRYSINWDKAQGPRAMIRYQFYSWRELALYARLEYRWATGWGGAFETEYFPTGHNISFVTRSYLGSDRLETAPNKERRYRVQGALHSETNDGKIHTTLTWDKYSDVRMPGDFVSEDFEVNTADRTLFYLTHRNPNFLSSLKIRPRVNPFESIQQEIPTIFFSSKPLRILKTGINFQIDSKVSYLDFSYSTQLGKDLSNFHSGRLEARPLLYRPFHFGLCYITPTIGAVGIFYSNSESNKAKFLTTLNYGTSLSIKGFREFENYRHFIEPYVNYTGFNRPTIPPYSHFIFSIQDGYNYINQTTFGIRSALYRKNSFLANPIFLSNLYTNTFIPHTKVYLNLVWQLPSIEISTHNAWNFTHQLLDFSNSRIQCTWNENVAFALDFRYRSPYDWRKSDHENFILDVSRSEQDLLASPLSDRRFTILTHFFFRLNSLWECHIHSHHGFLRKNQNPYNECKVDFFTWISTNWKLRFSYSHTQKDDRVTAGISLVKK